MQEKIVLFKLAALVAALGSSVLLKPAVSGMAESNRSSAGPVSGTGRLLGEVMVGAGLSSRRMRISPYTDVSQMIAPSPSTTGASSFGEELANVVIYLESQAPLQAGQRHGAERLTMEQKNEAFVPHMLPIVKGSTVDFLNGDPIFHNVFSLSKATSFDLGRYPRGSSRSVRFEQPGVVKVFCHIHADMSAIILVLDNPFFTTPDREGKFQIDDVPPGTYRAVAWHERARPVLRKVHIESGETSVVRFAVPLTESAGGG